MKNMRKTLAMVAAFALLATAFSFGAIAQEAASYTAGVYTAQANGRNDYLTVEVKVSDSAIESVTVVKHKETAGVADAALERIPAGIVQGQTLAVDTVSGCTITCEAILTAAEDCLIQAGANIELLKKKTETESVEQTLIVKEADAVIIGTGGAGLAAAVTVVNAGGSVIMIDKQANVGGNTGVSGGTFNAVDPARQSKFDVEDSVDLFVKNTYESGHEVGNLELVKILCENAVYGRYWLESLGCKWSEKIYLTIGGLWPRSMDTAGTSMENIVVPLYNAAKNGGAEILTEVKAEELIVKDGRVVGVKAFGVVDGQPYEIYGNKGVMLATGGYAANEDLMIEYAPNTPKGLQTNSSAYATGDGIVMAKAIGANLVGMEYVQMVPGSNKGDLGFINIIDNCFYINKEGNRFVDESSARDVLTNALLEQTDALQYVIYDSHTVNADFVSTRDNVSDYRDYVKYAQEGRCYYGETLEELAKNMGVDVDNFLKTVESFNKMVDGEITDPLGRTLFGIKIDQAPYYAARRKPKTHYTMGGVEINGKAQVMGVDNNVIEGLFAAGEVTGGIHGGNRIGGNALADCIVFGRIAGASIMGIEVPEVEVPKA